MSKFLDYLKCSLTKERYRDYESDRIFDLSLHEQSICPRVDDSGYLYKYYMWIDWKFEAKCEDEKALEHIKTIALLNLNNEIYSGFRKKLYELQIALHERDFKKALNLTSELDELTCPYDKRYGNN